MAERARVGVARRTLLSAVVGAAVLPAGACGIRLEDDAPRVPFVPTRTPVPAEPGLVALTRETAALAEAAAAVSGTLAADLETIHRRQHAVLRTTLVRQQVPAEDLDAPAPSTPTATATPTATPTPTTTATATGSGTPSPNGGASASPSTTTVQGGRAGLAEAEAASAAAAGTYAEVGADLRATVSALHAQRYAAATLLTGRAPTVPRDPVSGSHVSALASQTSGAIFLMEVVAARSDGKQRARADATLEALRDLRTDQLAGGARVDEALGHPLPFPVEDAADAERLAREVLTTLRAGYGEHLEPLVSAEGALGLAAITRWLGTVEVQAHRWGVPLMPFPGLS